MTEEELKKEAEEYAEGMAKYYASTHEDCIPSQFEKYLRNAYISSAEPREKHIAELEAQIEKMKRHANCNHCDSEGYCEVRKTYLMDLSYNGCDKWELED